MKTKIYHKRTFLPLQLTSWLCQGYDSNEFLSHSHNTVDIVYIR